MNEAILVGPHSKSPAQVMLRSHLQSGRAAIPKYRSTRRARARQHHPRQLRDADSGGGKRV